MIGPKDITKILKSYDLKKIHIATWGSHSALDICRGAKDEQFSTIILCKKGEGKLYDDYYGARNNVGVVDLIISMDTINDITDQTIQQFTRAHNAIFVPHRSLTAYLSNPYETIENKFFVPFFGNRASLRWEERTEKPNQYDLMRKAGIRSPKIITDYKKIDRLCMIKLPEKERNFERAFFLCSTPDEFEQITQKKIKAGQIAKTDIKKAVIEEYLIGPYVNFNFFNSVIDDRLELMGTDTRRQTNIDGILHLTAQQQLALHDSVVYKFEEAGHCAVTVLESLLSPAFELGQRLVDYTKKKYPPGIIGPFALQTAILPGPPKKEIVVFDISFRMPGSPGITATPYSAYLHGFPVSAGRRIAMEIKQAIIQKKLSEIIT